MSPDIPSEVSPCRVTRADGWTANRVAGCSTCGGDVSPLRPVKEANLWMILVPMLAPSPPMRISANGGRREEDRLLTAFPMRTSRRGDIRCR